MDITEKVINQAIADFDSIKLALEDSGVEVPYGTDTKEYAGLIKSMGDKPYQKGYNEGYDIGYTNGVNSVPIKEEQEKVVDITENGTVEVLPDENKVLSKVTVNANVPDTSELIENIIDESGVLEDSEATVTEKVEQLVDKAEDENLWYIISGFMTALPTGFRNSQIEKLPRMDLSSITTLPYGFSTMPLKTVEHYLNTDNCSDCNNVFAACYSLEYVKGINTSKCTKLSGMFSKCEKLTTVEEPLDFSSRTDTDQWAQNCIALKNIRFVKDSIKTRFVMAHSLLLSVESIQSIIDGLATVETQQKLTLHSTVGAKLTDEQLITIANKNWTVG